MSEAIRNNPILLLFLVAAIGYFFGSLRFRGGKLGVAAVLFVGLVFGALDSDFTIPDIVFHLGLVLFVYSIGISSGPAFFESYKKNGIRDFSFIVIMLVISGAIAVVLALIFDFSAATVTGMYSGSTTNTPALASVIDYVNQYPRYSSNPSYIMDMVVGYSFSYPMGVFGSILAIIWMEKWLKVNYDAEKNELKESYPVYDKLTSTSVIIENAELHGKVLRDVSKSFKKVLFGRVKQNGHISLSHWNTLLQKGDELMIIGANEDLEDFIEYAGKKAPKSLNHDRSVYDVRRIFVSNPNVAGKTLSSLSLNEKYNAIITRIRRGDSELLATGDTVLELGDRIRFIADRKDLDDLGKLFGDSYQKSSQINIFTFGIGIGLGLLLGTHEWHLPGNINFKLGYAGGPLIVALILGFLRRTGPILWSLPYGANMTLRQIGLVMLLATIGVKSGHTFIENLSDLQGLYIFIGSGVISILSALLTIYVGYKIIKIPFSVLMGIVANQPAILDFAMSRAKNQFPLIGYTIVFPIALILKILIAQIMFILLV